MAEVPHTGAAAEFRRQKTLDVEASHSARAGRDGRGDRRTGGIAGVAVDVECRAGVEAVPAEPEEEGAEDLEGCRVAAEVGVGNTLFETAETRTDDLCTDHGGHTTSHVHDAGSGEVDHTAHHGGRVPAAEEAGRIPDPVDDDGVDEANDDSAVDEVSTELATLGDSTRDDGGARGAEAVLEEAEPRHAARFCKVRAARLKVGCCFVAASTRCGDAKRAPPPRLAASSASSAQAVMHLAAGSARRSSCDACRRTVGCASSLSSRNTRPEAQIR